MFWLYVLFLVFVLLMLALDLGVFHRESHEVGLTEALAWTGVWVACAFLFNVLVYFIYENHWGGVGDVSYPEQAGRAAALDFFTGYLIEKSLSLDNIFVIALIFQYFAVPLKLQHRVLFWGILGALVLRGLMIGAGIALIHRFDWMVYVFGGFLLVTAGRMLLSDEQRLEPENNPLVRLIRRWFPLVPRFQGQKFFVCENGQWAVTPLFLALVLVEASDVLFAVDSIPAIFAITSDPFIVFTSNIFAILGLRSLYFVLAELVQRFGLLKYSLALLLGFVGVKMLLSHYVAISTLVSLAVIVVVLAAGIIGSLLHTPAETLDRPDLPPGKTPNNKIKER